MKDHEIAALVNDIRDIAVKFAHTQQLRQAIADRVVPALKAALSEPDLNLQCKSVQARLAMQWGYVKAEPDDMPNGSNCKWPTCQTEEYQQKLADDVVSELIGTPRREPLTHGEIRDVFLRSGFTIKEGQPDLKSYVYVAAYALLAAHGIGVKP